MRVVHIISSYSPGGAETLARDLCIEMKKKGHEIELWALGSGKDDAFERKFIKLLNENKVGTYCFLKRSNKDRVKTYLKMRQKIDSFKPDIIHVHGEELAFHVCLATLFRNNIIIQTIHNNKIQYPIIQNLFLKYKIDHFIAISKSVYKILNFRLNIPENKISIIYNGIPISGGLIDKNTRGKKIYIVNIGRLCEQKNQAKLIKSIYILKERFYRGKQFPFEVHIYGIGELKNHLIEMIKEYKMEKYIFLKGVDYDVSEKLNKYDLFILTSNWEGFPLSILEAMAKRVVVISTNVGSVSEIIDDQINGILIKSNSAEEIAEKVYHLSNNLFLVHKLAEDGYQKVKEKYDIRKCASEHIKLYTKLVK